MFIKKNKINKDGTISVLCSSPRRQYNLENFIRNYLPKKYKIINFENIRGNIPTRFKKFINSSENDCFIVAKAAIDRILLNQIPQFKELKKELKYYIDQCFWTIVPLSINPCSPGQGALAIESRIDDNNLNSLLKKKIIKNITSGIAFVNATFNNTIVTISDDNGNVARLR